MKFVVCRIDLGITRIAGYTVYDETSKEFQEKTPKEVISLIKKNDLTGLKLFNGKIEIDKEEFRMSNIMIKSGIGKFRKLYESDKLINCMYILVKVIYTDDNVVYEVVNNRCSRTKVSHEKLKMLMEMGEVAGAELLSNSKIKLCKGVTVDNRRSKKENEQLKKKETKENDNLDKGKANKNIEKIE